MSLTIFNGSPRGKSSNSSVICGWFEEGYGDTADTRYLNLVKNIPANLEAFLAADDILMVFPLYVDGMPGQVKAFFEGMIPYKYLVANKRITYIIHSGFSEGIQNRSLEKYLNRFSEIFRLNNNGVIIIPGSEGFRMMPPKMTKKKHQAVTGIGADFKSGVSYDEASIKTLNPRETSGLMSRIMFEVMARLGLTNMYWNSNLKKNGVYDQRFAAPYAEGPIKGSCPGYYSNKK